MKNISLVNKSARKAKKISSRLLIPNWGNHTGMKLIVYCDAALDLTMADLKKGTLSFLYIPISWQSPKIKRVGKSTLAAEILEACTFLQ